MSSHLTFYLHDHLGMVMGGEVKLFSGETERHAQSYAEQDSWSRRISRGDVDNSLMSGLIGYIGTPRGFVRKFDLSTGKFSTVDDRAPFDSSQMNSNQAANSPKSIGQTIINGGKTWRTFPVNQRSEHEYQNNENK